MKSIGITTVILVVLGCNQGTSQETNNSKKADTVIGSTIQNINDAEHSLIQFEVDNKLCFATINQSFKDYKNKQAFPYSLWVTVETLQKNTNGHPTDDEATLFNNLEDGLVEAFDSRTPFCYIGRTTRDGYREIMFYVSDKQKASEIIAEFVKKNKFGRKIQYEINEDKNWESTSGLYR